MCTEHSLIREFTVSPPQGTVARKPHDQLTTTPGAGRERGQACSSRGRSGSSSPAAWSATTSSAVTAAMTQAPKARAWRGVPIPTNHRSGSGPSRWRSRSSAIPRARRRATRWATIRNTWRNSPGGGPWPRMQSCRGRENREGDACLPARAHGAARHAHHRHRGVGNSREQVWGISVSLDIRNEMLRTGSAVGAYQSFTEREFPVAVLEPGPGDATDVEGWREAQRAA